MLLAGSCRFFHHNHPSQQTSSLPFCRRIVGNIAHWMCFVSDQNRGMARHRENSWTTCSGPCSVYAASKFFVGNGMILLLEEKHLKCPWLTLWDLISQWKKEHLEDHQLKNLI